MPSGVREAGAGRAASRDRPVGRLLIGLGAAVAVVLGSALAARWDGPAAGAPRDVADGAAPDAVALRPPRAAFSLVWPPLFLALTVSGLRIWNAPRSPARSQALTLWGMVQALNALWMALGPRRLGGPLITAVTSLGASAAYVWRARRVDAPAAGMVAPYVGWIGFANVLTEELWRKPATKPTIH